MTEQIPMGEAQVEKDLIQLTSGNYAEAIYFNRPEKQVVCFSTQLSCAVGCAFCASPGEEKTVNLTEEEMLQQVNTMMEKYSPKDVNTIVLFSVMGEGEPLLNYKNVLSLLHTLPKIYKNCRISLSTSGAKPNRIKDLAHEVFAVPFKLQVSLHSLNSNVRKWFMPLAKSVEEIKEAIDYYHSQKPNAPVELNFALIDGINDSLEDAELIIKYFPTEHIKISQFNPIIRTEFESSPKKKIEEFVEFLRLAGIDVEYHATDGSKIGAACGQTRGMRK